MSSRGIAGRTWADFRAHWRQALAFHLLMQLLGFAVFTPLVTWVARRIVQSSGDPVISNFDIAAFLLSPTGAAFVIVVAALTVSLLLGEFAGLSWIAGHALAKRRVTVVGTIALVLRKLPRLIGLSARVFVRLVLLAAPFVAGAGLVWLTTLAGHDINYYLADRPPEWRRALLIAGILGALLVLLAAWLLARWLYAVPALVLEDTPPRRALADSTRATRGRLLRIVALLVVWWLLVTAAAVAITWVCRQMSDAGLDWAGIDARRVLPLVALFVTVSLVGGFLYSGVHLTGHQFLVTRMYAEQVDPARWRALASPDAVLANPRRLALPAIVVVVLLLVSALGLAWLAASRVPDAEVAITAHRGASLAAPENTLAAFRAAMDAGATYAELDVQHTRDGEIVVLHDGDLLRMADDARKLADLSAADVATIDVGRKRDVSFAGEHVPRLEEVIDLVRGRMKLNVELKYNVPDPSLARDVVELLRRAAFLDDAVITSLDYAAIKQVEEIEPRLRTGHIVTAAVGNVTRTDADFLSLNSAQAKPSLIRQAHAAGKEIHVWTVNTPEVMVRMIERGVDNIITDDPGLLARVIGERRILSRAELIGLRLRVLFASPPPELTDPALVQPL